MKIRKLTGWPPDRFQTTESKGIYTPAIISRLHLQSAYLVPSLGPRVATEVLLILSDATKGRDCFTRFKVKEPGTAIRMVKAMAENRGRTLAEIGDLEIREEETSPLIAAR